MALQEKLDKVEQLKDEVESLNGVLVSELKATLDKLEQKDREYQTQIRGLNDQLNEITRDINDVLPTLGGGNYYTNTSEPASLNWDDYPTEQF